MVFYMLIFLSRSFFFRDVCAVIVNVAYKTFCKFVRIWGTCTVCFNILLDIAIGKWDYHFVTYLIYFN